MPAERRIYAVIFDTHCHLDDERFNEDREDAYLRMLENDVKYCVCVGSDMASSCRCLELANSHEGVFAACGVHPHEAKDAAEGYLEELRQMLQNEKCVALGEIGLDYYYDLSPRDVQMDVCEKQMQLAYRLGAESK